MKQRQGTTLRHMGGDKWAVVSGRRFLSGKHLTLQQAIARQRQCEEKAREAKP